MTSFSEDDPLVEVLREIANRMPRSEDVRTDHPLQGETFGEIVSALQCIAEGLDNVAEAIRGREDPKNYVAPDVDPAS